MCASVISIHTAHTPVCHVIISNDGQMCITAPPHSNEISTAPDEWKIKKEKKGNYKTKHIGNRLPRLRLIRLFTAFWLNVYASLPIALFELLSRHRWSTCRWRTRAHFGKRNCANTERGKARILFVFLSLRSKWVQLEYNRLHRRQNTCTCSDADKCCLQHTHSLTRSLTRCTHAICTCLGLSLGLASRCITLVGCRAVRFLFNGFRVSNFRVES